MTSTSSPPLATRTRGRYRAALGLCLGLLLVTHMLGVWWSAHAQSPHAQADVCPADTLLVMGAAQYDGRPSPAFARRLERALELYLSGCAPHVVVTGGNQPGDRFTEGGAGLRYLRERGVPAAALSAETQSRSSFENLTLSRPLLSGERLVIVTDDLHAYRTELLARHLGLEATVATVATHGPRLRYALREAAGVAASLLGIYR